MDGFRTIWGHRDLRLVSGVYCAQTVVAGASIAFGVAIAVEMTDFGSRGVGYLDSVFGVGALLGGLVAICRASRQRLASDFGVGVIFWALPLLLVAAIPQTLPAFASLFIIGSANPVVDVNASTILQRLPPMPCSAGCSGPWRRGSSGRWRWARSPCRCSSPGSGCAGRWS